MSRHRIVRSMNYSDEYDGYEDVYGHSVEDDYSISPSEAAFMYDRNNREPARISAFLTTEKDIAEEDESDPSANEPERRDSQSSIRQHLSDIDEARLRSCLDEVRNVIGDSLPENILVETILRCEFDVTRALDELLSSPHKSKKDESPKPQRIRNQHQKDKQDEKDINFSFTPNSTSYSCKSSGNENCGKRNISFVSSKSKNHVFDVAKKNSRHQKVSGPLRIGQRAVVGDSSKLQKNVKRTEQDVKLGDEEFGTDVSLSSLMASHKREGDKNERRCKLDLTTALCSSDTGIEGVENSFDECETGLSSLSSLRSRQKKFNDILLSDDIPPSSSLVNISVTDTEAELKTLSLNDLLMKHKTDVVSLDDTQSFKMAPSIVGSSLSELFLKHKDDVFEDDSDDVRVDDNLYETERTSSLSKLAKRYRDISISQCDDSSIDSGSVSSLLELAIKHNEMSVSKENVHFNDKTRERMNNLSISSSSSDLTSAVIGSLPNKFKMLSVDAVDDSVLSRSLPDTNGFNVLRERFHQHSAMPNELNSGIFTNKKQVNIDLTCALRSPEKVRLNQEVSKERDSSVERRSSSPSDKLYLVDFVDNVPSEKEEQKVSCEPVISTYSVTSLQDKQTFEKATSIIKECSPFGKIVCKEFLIVEELPYIPNRIKVKCEIRHFDFNSISPDDKILSHLKKQRPNYMNTN